MLLWTLFIWFNELFRVEGTQKCIDDMNGLVESIREALCATNKVTTKNDTIDENKKVCQSKN